MIMMPAIIVAGHLAVAVADRPPALNIEQTCREETTGALQTNDKIDVCIEDEKHARDQLTAQWSSYNAGARARCARTATSGHVSSYLELLVCLDLDQADREVHGQGSTTGLTITEPARSAERDDTTDSPPSRTAPVAAPSRPAPPPRSQQQQGAARSAAAAPPAPAPAAPLQVSPPAAEPPPPTQGEVLQQSFCRSPLGYVLPNCR